MRYIELLIDGKSIKSQYRIDLILKSSGLDWIIDSEIENAVIEFKKNTIIWHSGYFFGNWKYGIFKNGEFHGTWSNGIFEGGVFKGVWKSGIKINQQ